MFATLKNRETQTETQNILDIDFDTMEPQRGGHASCLFGNRVAMTTTYSVCRFRFKMALVCTFIVATTLSIIAIVSQPPSPPLR